MMVVISTTQELDWGVINKWSQLLTILGFVITIISLIVSLTIKSKVNQLRASYTFDKRIDTHIKQLKAIASTLNGYFNDYDSCTHLIKVELGKCQSELEDIATKLTSKQSRKIRKLIKYIRNKKNKRFSLRANDSNNSFWNGMILMFKNRYQTSYDDIWLIYSFIYEIIIQIENIKKNKKTMLN